VEGNLWPDDEQIGLMRGEGHELYLMVRLREESWLADMADHSAMAAKANITVWSVQC
jgi:hypothetical protein